MNRRLLLAEKVSEIENCLKEARECADKGDAESETNRYRWALELLGEVIFLSAGIAERSFLDELQKTSKPVVEAHRL